MAYRLTGTYVAHCDCRQIDVTFEAFRDPTGAKTTARNAPFGLAPEFTLGRSSGTSGVFGDSFEANYGETAQFEWAS